MKAKGSMTVEASYLMPVLFIVIIVMEFLLFYAYDRTALWTDTYHTALLIVQNERDNREYNINEKWEELCKSTLVLHGKDKVSVKYGINKVKVTGQIEFYMPFFGKIDMKETSVVSLGNGKKKMARALKWK